MLSKKIQTTIYVKNQIFRLGPILGVPCGVATTTVSNSGLVKFYPLFIKIPYSFNFSHSIFFIKIKYVIQLCTGTAICFSDRYFITMKANDLDQYRY